jgi:hypothetical protein
MLGMVGCKQFAQSDPMSPITAPSKTLTVAQTH